MDLYISRLGAATQAFLRDETTAPHDRTALLDYLDARPNRQRDPPFFIDDVVWRVDRAREVQRTLEQSGLERLLNPLSWSILMVVSIDRIWQQETPEGIIHAVTPKLRVLMKIFLTKPASQISLADAESERGGTTDVQRNVSESDKCLLRDQQCVVTRARDPDVCHIFPLSSLSSPARTSDALLNSLYLLWGSERRNRLRPVIVGPNNIVDTAQNMVALNPLLYRWWSEGTIAFEPLGRLQKGVRLRLRWLRKAGVGLYDRMPLDSDPREVMPASHAKVSDGLRHFDTGRLILDGEIIDVVSEDILAIPSMEIFELQWDLLRMISLSGAAEAARDPSWDPDLEYPSLAILVPEEEEAKRRRDQSWWGVTVEESLSKGEGKAGDANWENEAEPPETNKTDGRASGTGDASSTEASRLFDY